MTKKRNPVPAAQRKAMIVQTVIRLAGERNPESITTSEMAAELDLTQAALFRHFPTKEAIRTEVMEWTAEHLTDAVKTAADAQTDSLSALEAAFHAHLKFASERPGVPRILFSELQNREDTPVKQAALKLMNQYRKILCDRIAQGKADGQIRNDVDDRTAAAALLGLIQGLILQSLLSGKPATRKQAQATFAVFRRGIEGGSK